MTHRARVRRPVRNFVVNGAVVCLSLVLLSAVGEMGCRLGFPQWRHAWSQGFLVFDDRMGTYVGKAAYEGRLTSIFGEYDVAVRLDSKGFRNGVDSDPASSELVFLGDSFGFGWGVEMGNVYAAVAAQRLNRPFTNYSVPATDVADYLVLAKAIAPHLAERTLVVLVTFENDVLSYPPAETIDSRRQPPGANQVFKWLIENSAFVSVAFAVLQRSEAFVLTARRLGLLAPSGASVDGERDSVTATVEMLLATRREAREAERFVVMVVPPRPQLELTARHAAFLERLRAEGFDVLNPGIEEGDFFPYDGHWTAQAHARAGRLLEEFLKR